MGVSKGSVDIFGKILTWLATFWVKSTGPYFMYPIFIEKCKESNKARTNFVLRKISKMVSSIASN